MDFYITSGLALTNKSCKSGSTLILSRIYKQIIKHKLHMVEFAFYFLCGVLMFAITCIALLILADMILDRWTEFKYGYQEYKKRKAWHSKKKS